MKRLAVYCGSSDGIDPTYGAAAEAVGRALARRGMAIVYGGGRLGLMGRLADAALAAGGEVIGVIPQALRDAEVEHRGCTTLHIVATMHERKALMTDLADGFVALPGGIGTMDELFEALSWLQLGYHAKPVGLLNVGGFFDPLIAFMDRARDSGFIRADHRANLIEGATIDALLDRFAAWTAAPSFVQIARGEL